MTKKEKKGGRLDRPEASPNPTPDRKGKKRGEGKRTAISSLHLHHALVRREEEKKKKRGGGEGGASVARILLRDCLRLDSERKEKKRGKQRKRPTPW